MTPDVTGLPPAERYKVATEQVEHHRSEQGRWGEVRRAAIAEMRQTMTNAAVGEALGIHPSTVTKLSKPSAWSETMNDGIDGKDVDAVEAEMLRRREEIMRDRDIVHAWQVAEKLGAYASVYHRWKKNHSWTEEALRSP